MAEPQTNHSLSYNIDQEIILDSDRRFSSVSSATHNENENNNESKKANSQKSIYMEKGDPKQNSIILPNMGSYDLKSAGHPIACIATVLFKGAALFFYLFMSLVLPNVIVFIFVMVLAALDFWTVKNVTGRLLVGLRWWSQYNQKGDQVWKFESFNKEYQSNSVDKTFFWTGQIVATLIWGFFLLMKILSLSLFWGILTVINFGLCGLNLYGYYKCQGDYKSKLKALKSQGLSKLAGKILFK